jgi:hypothetical protein
MQMAYQSLPRRGEPAKSAKNPPKWQKIAGYGVTVNSTGADSFPSRFRTVIRTTPGLA